MRDVTSAEFDSIVNSGKPVLVKFYSTTCVPCKILHKTLEAIEPAVAEVEFIQIEPNNGSEIFARYGIMGVPVLMYFKNGMEVIRKSGVQGRDAIMKMIFNS